MKIIRTLWIDAFVENKVFAVLFGNEGIATVWAAKFYGGKPAVLWREACSADFAEDLAFGTVVFIEVRFGASHLGQVQ